MLFDRARPAFFKVSGFDFLYFRNAGWVNKYCAYRNGHFNPERTTVQKVAIAANFCDFLQLLYRTWAQML